MKANAVRRSPETVNFQDPSETIRFGLIVLATDLTSEGDLSKVLPQAGVALHTTRVAYENPTTPENLRKMAPRLAEAAKLLLPVQPLHAVCYSCTAASVVLGDEAVTRAINDVIGGVPVVTPSGAARLAFQALEARRIAILTPYTIETSQPVVDYFRHTGLEICRAECLGIEDDRDMARVDNMTIVDAAIGVDVPQADALFISCTALPAAGSIAEIEQRTGKPVVTSNQATAWAMARLGRFHALQPESHGRLFKCPLPENAYRAAA